jgi:hypothetical protein
VAQRERFKGWKIVFKGKSMGREAFMNDFYEKIAPFLSKSFTVNYDWVMLYTLFNEIVKNIYDHADGKGEAIFWKNNVKKRLYFQIKDYGTKRHSLAKIKKEAKKGKPGNGINFGAGIATIIPGLALNLNIPLKIDTSCGFCYSGLFSDADTCGLCLPNFDSFVKPDSNGSSCLLTHHYSSEHICRLESGKYIRWEYDNECTSCEKAGDTCECFIWNEITLKEVERMQKEAHRERADYFEEVWKEEKKLFKDKVPA